MADNTQYKTPIDQILHKIENQNRISINETIALWQLPLPILADLANKQQERINRNKVYFVKNIHVEPTNICQNDCKFCSFRKKENSNGSYSLSIEQIIEKITAAGDIQEVHIVGGVNKKYNLQFYTTLFETIRNMFPSIHRKGLTAEEIHFLSKEASISIKETVKELINSGLESMPGGGAEIFAPKIRQILCPNKLTGEQWIEIHETAHKQGITTNATMMYGHIETIEDRITHLDKLRELQDKTGGFNAFIPLKYKVTASELEIKKEVNSVEDLKTVCISRLFLDNIPHIKSYWPNIGFENAILAINFGADDLDGTISQSTEIYAPTGNINKNGISPEKIIEAIKKNGKTPIQRDALYNVIKTHNS